MALTTEQAAEKCGVSRRTLITWMQRGLVPAPRLRISTNGFAVRMFSERDVQRILSYKRKNFRKGRGRKKAKR